MTRYAAKGTQLLIGDGATPTEVFTEVAQLNNIDVAGFVNNTEAATDHDSPEFAEQHVVTTRAYGEVAIEGHWDPELATQDETTGLYSKFKGGVSTNWKLQWPQIGATGFEQGPFSATLTNFKTGPFSVEGKIPFSATLLINGVVPDPVALP